MKRQSFHLLVPSAIACSGQRHGRLKSGDQNSFWVFHGLAGTHTVKDSPATPRCILVGSPVGSRGAKTQSWHSDMKFRCAKWCFNHWPPTPAFCFYEKGNLGRIKCYSSSFNYSCLIV